MSQEDELKSLCIEVARRFPGRPFIVVLGADDGGMLSMGNLDEDEQRRTLQGLLQSFRAGTARTIHKGPAK